MASDFPGRVMMGLGSVVVSSSMGIGQVEGGWAAGGGGGLVGSTSWSFDCYSGCGVGKMASDPEGW